MGQQIVITIPEDIVGGDILKIIQELSVEDKKQVASDVMKGFFESSTPFDMEAYKKTLVADIRCGNIQVSRYRLDEYTDEAILGLDEARKLIASHLDPKQMFLLILRDEVLELYKEQVKEQLKNDPRVKLIQDTILEELIKDFPNLIQQAIVISLSSQLGTMGTQIADAYFAANNTMITTQRIQDQLREKGLITY